MFPRGAGSLDECRSSCPGQNRERGIAQGGQTAPSPRARRRHRISCGGRPGRGCARRQSRPLEHGRKSGAGGRRAGIQIRSQKRHGSPRLVSVEMENPGDGIKNGMNKHRKPIHVVLADDHTLVRAGIRALLEKLPAVKVIGEASDGREVLNLVKTQRPEVVLMDIAMPGLNGLESAERMVRDFPGVRIIILTMHDNEEYVLRALKAGVAGYLLKKSATAELETALHQVLRGEIYLSREIKLHKKFPLHGITDRKSPLEQLTGRQREIYLSRGIKLQKKFPLHGIPDRKSPLEQLNGPAARNFTTHRRGPEHQEH